MCNSNNLLYSPKPHEFRAYRADGTKVVKGDKLVTGDRVWDFVSCTHPRKIFVENLEDPKGPRMWPNRISQEFYASVFNLGIYDVTDSCWSFEPNWTHSDIEPGTDNLTDADVWASYDKNVQADSGDKTYTTDTERNKKFWAQVDEPAKTDMWELIDQMFQRVTKCDGTVILTPRGESDIPDKRDKTYATDTTHNKDENKHMLEADIPWVSPGPSESEKTEQAERVRRADAWVETGVWEKSDRTETWGEMVEANDAELPVNTDEPYKHYDLGNQGNRETYTDEYPKAETAWEGPNYDENGETDIADDDDKAELIREYDEQHETDKKD